MVTNFPKAGDDQAISLNNSNYPQFDYAWALKLKNDSPKTWARGGNIYGNRAFAFWGKARAGDKSAAALRWIRKREAWAAKHYQDFRVPGVVAQVKWGVIGKLGESGMKQLLNEQKTKDADGLYAIDAMAFYQQPNDAAIVRLIITDNLVSRNDARYPAAELSKLASLLPDVAASVDHSWAVEHEWARVARAGVVQTEPPLYLDNHNQAIVAAEGYWQVWADLRVLDESVLERFDAGLSLRVSLSAAYESMRCPVCDCRSKDMRSLDCPNQLWDSPYYERHGVVDVLEVSLVLIPAVRSAAVVGLIQTEEMN